MFNLKRLQDAFEESGMTRIDVDRACGHEYPMFDKYLKGYRDPSPKTLYRFLSAMGWSMDKIKNMRMGDWYD